MNVSTDDGLAVCDLETQINAYCIRINSAPPEIVGNIRDVHFLWRNALSQNSYKAQVSAVILYY